MTRQAQLSEVGYVLKVAAIGPSSAGGGVAEGRGGVVKRSQHANPQFFEISGSRLVFCEALDGNPWKFWDRK